MKIIIRIFIMILYFIIISLEKIIINNIFSINSNVVITIFITFLNFNVITDFDIKLTITDYFVN